jgi:Aminopeptidase P, N-terminal domain
MNLKAPHAHRLSIEHDNSERGYKMTMFVPPKNAEAELWDGPRTGLEGVKEMFDADEVNHYPCER